MQLVKWRLTCGYKSWLFVKPETRLEAIALYFRGWRKLILTAGFYHKPGINTPQGGSRYAKS